MNNTMKAAIFEKTGNPQDVLQVKDIPIPTPGDGEVRIKVTACNINPSDVMFVHGLYGIRPELPAVGGFEATGTIDECGTGVTLTKGMAVIFTAIGVWQEYVIVPAKTVLPKPENMPATVACQAFVNPFTAYGMLETANLQAGQYLLLTAGGSAFSKFVIQIAKIRGIKVICTLRRDEGSNELIELGATAVVNTEKEVLYKRIKEITAGEGVDYVFEAVGGKIGEKALECLKIGGTMMVYGLLSLQSTPVNNGLVLFKNLCIKGFWLSTWMTQLNKEEKIGVTQEVFRLLSSSQLKTNIEKKYPLDQIKEAIFHSEKTGRTGKIILDLAL